MEDERTMKALRWVVPVISFLAWVGCDKKESAPEALASTQVAPEKPKAGLNQSCSSNEDCADRLGCGQDKRCLPYKTIECQKRPDACDKEGRCTGSDTGCVAGSDAECSKSEVCKENGQCKAKDGKCVAASDADCKALCTELGRCKAVDGACSAETNDDCRQATVCTAQKKCRAHNGLCTK